MQLCFVCSQKKNEAQMSKLSDRLQAEKSKIVLKIFFSTEVKVLCLDLYIHGYGAVMNFVKFFRHKQGIEQGVNKITKSSKDVT